MKVMEEDTLSIFTDNAIDHRRSASEGWRSYNMFGLHANYPKTAGVVLGMSETTPFKGLHVDLSVCPRDNTCDPFFCNRLLIDESLEEIHELIKKHRYENISVKLEMPADVGHEVRVYVWSQIVRLEDYRSLN